LGEKLKKTYFWRFFDMCQQKGCYRTQFDKNACTDQKIAVPLHRQKTLGYLSFARLTGKRRKPKGLRIRVTLLKK
jgi:hypothetical protein